MKRLHLNLDLTGVIITLVVGVLLPVLLSTAVGIVALVIAEDTGGIVTGVLVISFACAATGSALVALVLAKRKVRLARAQSDFVANVSHEFKTPLSAIRLYAQTLQSGKVADDPEQEAICVDTILRETEWLELMVDRVLTWRSSPNATLPLNLECRPLAGTINQTIERFRRMIPPGSVRLSSQIDSDVTVNFDEHALHTVMINLLTNAYKYTGRDKKIGVSVRDEDDKVLIEVTDNGVGISPRNQKHVFQPFYRVGEEHREGTSGTGLGLAIVRDLVLRHGGTVDVESEEGIGATFRILLPIAKDES
jgi:signal transduction histidine kinase